MNEVKQRYPEAKQVEFSVISLMLKSRDAIEKSFLFDINLDSFYNSNTRNIFSAINSLYINNSVVDINTVQNELEKMKLNIEYNALVSLTEKKVDHVDNLEGYITILKDMEKERNLFVIADELKSLAILDGKSTEEKFSKAISMFEGEVKSEENTYNMKNDSQSFLDTLKKNIENPGQNLIDLPWEELNHKIGGFTEGIHIFGGQPGDGKTGVAEQIIYHNVFKGKTCIFFSAEMTFNQINYRHIQRELGIQTKDMMKGNISKEDYERIVEFTKTFPDNLIIDTSSGLDVKKLVIKAKMHNKRKKIDFIVVDYLQILKSFGKKTKLEEVNDIIQQLTQLAKDLNIPVIALSQLNGFSNNDDGRPNLENLKESKTLGEAAVSAIILHRPFKKEQNIKKYITEFIIVKDRYGGNNYSHRLTFDGPRIKLNEMTEYDVNMMNEFNEEENKPKNKKVGFK